MMNLLLSSLDKGARFFRQRQFFCRFVVSSEAHSIKFAASTTRQCPFLSHLESTSIKALPKTALTTFRMNTSKSVSEQRTLTGSVDILVEVGVPQAVEVISQAE